MSIPVNIDTYQLNLFATVDEMTERRLAPAVQERLLRLRALYTYWLNFPGKSTREMVDHDMKVNEGLRQSEAYDDIRLIKILMGNIEAEAKEWHRYVFNKRSDELYRKAMEAKDWRTAERVNADYAKYNRVGEIDTQPVDYSDITPHAIEPTDDPTVIGIAPIKDLREKIRRLKRKLGADIEDADFIEVKEESDG